MSKSVVILIGIIVLAAGLRLYGLDRQSLWYDEVAEETAFQRQFLDVKTVVSGIPDTPPLNAFFVYPVTKVFPDNDFALRMVPFTFGLISIPLFFLLSRKLFDEKIGLIVSFLLAISPFHIWYSQEARMYALFLMLTLISLIYFLRAIEQPGRGNYIKYIISTVACLYTLQLAVFLLLLQALYLLWYIKKYKAQIFKWLIASGTVVILYLPWIIHQITSLKNRGMAYPKDVEFFIFLPYTIYSYFAGFGMGPSLKELHIDQSLHVVKPYLSVIGLLMGFYITLIILGLWSLRSNPSKLFLLILLIVVPIGGVIMLDIITPMSSNVRYTGVALFGILLCTSKGIEWLLSLKPKMIGRSLFVLTIVLVVAFSAYSYAGYQFNKKYAKPDIREAVTYIKENMKVDDALLCIVDLEVFNRYLKPKDAGCLSLRSDEINNKEKIKVAVQKAAEGKKRLWLILSREWYADKYGYAKAWLDANYEEIKDLHRGITDIANIRIYCYDLLKKKYQQDTGSN